MNKSVIRKAVKAATARAAEQFAQEVFDLNLKAFALGLRIEVVEPKVKKKLHAKGTWKGTLGTRVDARGYRVTKARLDALAKARSVRAANLAARAKG